MAVLVGPHLLAAAAVAAGVPPDKLRLVIAIGMAESSGHPGEIGDRTHR